MTMMMISSTMHRCGVTLNSFMKEQYQDMMNEYGLPAVLAGLESAASNGKAGVLKYVRQCVVSAYNGNGTAPPVNGKPPSTIRVVRLEENND
jgi:hypothetical protein